MMGELLRMVGVVQGCEGKIFNIMQSSLFFIILVISVLDLSPYYFKGLNVCWMFDVFRAKDIDSNTLK